MITWTDEKIEYLKKWKKKAVPDEATAEMMSLKFKEQVTTHAVRMKSFTLKLGVKVHRWTKEENEHLEFLYIQGVSFANISKKMTTKFDRRFSLPSCSTKVGGLQLDRTRRRRWTKEENEHLKKMYKQGVLFFDMARQMTKRFGRDYSYPSCKDKIKALDLSGRCELWTKKECDTLKQGMALGLALKEIAKKLPKRSLIAIERKSATTDFDF